MAPDGIMGQFKGTDGKLTFIGSNLGKLFQSTGTPDDPFQTVQYANGIVEDVDRNKYHYASVAQVIEDTETGNLIGITHVEEDDPQGAQFFVSSIALSISQDKGLNWYFLGVVMTHNVPHEKSLGTNRDIANGTIFVKDGYLYIYGVDIRNEPVEFGLSVARTPLVDLFTALTRKTREKKLPEFKKLKDGQWNEPGLGGDFTNLLPEGVSPNFCYVQYNTVLKKYIMAMCNAPYYQSNDGDILLLVSDDFTDWTKASRQFVACSRKGEQYPTMIGLGDDSQLESGSEFYLYYCKWDGVTSDADYSLIPDWQRLWGTCEYVRRKITVK